MRCSSKLSKIFNYSRQKNALIYELNHLVTIGIWENSTDTQTSAKISVLIGLFQLIEIW